MSPISIDATTDLFGLKNGQYVYEGTVPAGKNYPPALVGVYHHINISVTGRIDFQPNGYGTICVVGQDGRSYRNTLNYTNWTGWAKQSTATKPTEYALPLAAGVTAASAAPKYWRDGGGNVGISGTITFAAMPAGGKVIATLPAGYRPATQKTIILQSGGNTSTYGWVMPNGNIQLSGGTPPANFATEVIAIITPPFFAAV